MTTLNSTQATPDTLTRFVPFSECGPEELIVLADHSWVEVVKRGHELAALGVPDDWDYYLLEGTLKLTAADGKESFVMGGSRTARMPVAHLRPRRYSISAMTKVTYLRVESALLKNLSFSGADAGVVVEEEQATGDLDNPLYATIQDDLIHDRLDIPSMPEVAIKVRHMVEQEDVSIPKLAKVIQADPALSAKLIKAANGCLYLGQPRVETCGQAITRLGLNATQHLVVSFVLKNLFQEKISNDMLNHVAHELWHHSVEIASISRVLANTTPGLDSDEALLAGLLHDIGELVILSYADQYPQFSQDETNLHAIISQCKGEIGAAVLREWKFPDELVAAAAESELWSRDHSEKADYCDVVLVAHLHSYFGTAKMAGLPGLADVPAFGKLADGKLTPEVSMLVLDESKEMIHETRRLFLS